jgi:hypothetical protein
VTRMIGAPAIAALSLAIAAQVALAHITPPVVLASDRDAVLRLLPGARRFFVKEIRLSPAQQQAIRTKTGWTPDETFYRFYLGRDEGGRLVSSTVFLTEYTIHGPVRVAVGLDPQGRVSGAQVVELTEETYPWLKPLLDRDFTRAYVGRDGHGSFALPDRVAGAIASMPRFYAQIVASLLQRAALLYEVAVVATPGPA